MKLYYAPGACSLAVHIALREVGVTFDGISVDRTHHTTVNGVNFHDISPRGYVPLLHLKSYLMRVSARPRVHEALCAEGLAK